MSVNTIYSSDLINNEILSQDYHVHASCKCTFNLYFESKEPLEDVDNVVKGALLLAYINFHNQGEFLQKYTKDFYSRFGKQPNEASSPSMEENDALRHFQLAKENYENLIQALSQLEDKYSIYVKREL